ncbi:MAG: peptidylprolyl isomerase [Casimicrobiaceae bacterium]
MMKLQQGLSPLWATLLALVIALVPFRIASAQSAAVDTVLISNSVASVTRADYEVELLKLPPDLRAGFANNPKRVNDLLVRMLTLKSLAAQAKAARLDASPEASRRMQLEIDRLLSQIKMESVEAAATAEFDANLAKYETRARELYMVDRASFATPAQVSATHILYDTRKHTSEEAKKLAQDARARIAAGADMGKLAHEASDDPSAKANNGTLGWFTQKEMDPAFGEAAFALKNAGDLSEPVLSQFGWHIIRLDGRRPAAVRSYDEAHDEIMAQLRKRYVDEKKDEVLAAIRRDPKTQVNRDAVDALTPRVDPATVKRAIEAAPSGMPPAAGTPR